MSDIYLDPLVNPSGSGVTLTPFHLAVLGCGAASLALAQMNLPAYLASMAGMWRRAMMLLVLALIMHGIISNQLTLYKERTNKLSAEFKHKELDKVTKFKEQKSDWDNISAHPSAFLTTKDGKPRLFPFPLGKAGGSASLKGELWWEAGNSAHVGHFNQKETPEAREAIREEMQAKEEERVKVAKKAIKAYEDNRKKWAKRLANIKLLMLIIVIGLFHRKAAVVALAALIYYVFATEIAGMLALKKKDEEEDRPVRKKKVPNTPGMAMTYIYEPVAGGDVEAAVSIPVKAPSHRLTTSTDNRYAS